MRWFVATLLLCLLSFNAFAEEHGIASVDTGKPTPFDCCLFHHRVATGAKFDQFSMTAAHRTLPLGTIVSVTNKISGESAYVKINDRGPCHSKPCRGHRPDLLNRIIDLTPEAADQIGLRGLGPVVIRVCKVWRTGAVPIRSCH